MATNAPDVLALPSGYTLLRINSVEQAMEEGKRTRTAVGPFYEIERKKNRGAEFFALHDSMGTSVAVMGVLPEGQRWGTGEQINQRVHVAGVHNANPYPLHGAAIVEAGQQAFQMDLSFEQASNQYMRPRPVEAGPSM